MTFIIFRREWNEKTPHSGMLHGIPNVWYCFIIRAMSERAMRAGEWKTKWTFHKTHFEKLNFMCKLVYWVNKTHKGINEKGTCSEAAPESDWIGCITKNATKYFKLFFRMWKKFRLSFFHVKCVVLQPSPSSVQLLMLLYTIFGAKI